MASDVLHPVLETLVRERVGGRADVLSVRTTPLRGGLSAGTVAVVRVEHLDAAGRRRWLALVAKTLTGFACREIEVYRHLHRHGVAAPRVLAIERRPGAATLFLEWVPAVARWPWRETTHGEAVLRAAAAMHGTGIAYAPPWDYDAELRSRAAATLSALAAARLAEALPIDAASLCAVRRIADAVCLVRHEVVLRGPFARTLIHGDLHPGNVILSRGGATAGPVLLDWGRARVGSPLEDVASWVQSLGCWEPEARARHDSLLAAYLRARGCGSGIAPAVRDSYWLAGATNALAGALMHHLDVAVSGQRSRGARAKAWSAARDWLRIIRRAEATWRDPGRAPRGVRARRTPGSYGVPCSSPPPRSMHSSVERRSTSPR